MIWRTGAPGKINLCLWLGPLRADGYHELISLIQSLTLEDSVQLEFVPAASTDEVVCPGVEGPNLVSAAIAAYRKATGWPADPVRVTIDKRVPVAAGMGGGSADAAAALRLLATAAGRAQDPVLDLIAPELGSDVPSQLRPGLNIVAGAGEEVSAAGTSAPYGVLVQPLGERLSTADVYREADRLGLVRSRGQIADRRRELQRAIDLAGDRPLRIGADIPYALLVNDLEQAARSLCPAIDPARRCLEDVGADHVMVSGSGPTVVGLFFGFDGLAEARAAADELGIAPGNAVGPVLA